MVRRYHVSALSCFLFVLFCASSSHGQFKKGGDTRAVIIGVSEYQEENIPDLRFAHKDAEAFAKYLSTPSGGKVPMENIKLLTNKDATCGNAHKALYWLLEQSNKNDKAIIYFSGHGDVEAIFEDEPSHFLQCTVKRSKSVV